MAKSEIKFPPIKGSDPTRTSYREHFEQMHREDLHRRMRESMNDHITDAMLYGLGMPKTVEPYKQLARRRKKLLLTEV